MAPGKERQENGAVDCKRQTEWRGGLGRAGNTRIAATRGGRIELDWHGTGHGFTSGGDRTCRRVGDARSGRWQWVSGWTACRWALAKLQQLTLTQPQAIIIIAVCYGVLTATREVERQVNGRPTNIITGPSRALTIAPQRRSAHRTGQGVRDAFGEATRGTQHRQSASQCWNDGTRATRRVD